MVWPYAKKLVSSITSQYKCWPLCAAPYEWPRTSPHSPSLGRHQTHVIRIFGSRIMHPSCFGFGSRDASEMQNNGPTHCLWCISTFAPPKMIILPFDPYLMNADVYAFGITWVLFYYDNCFLCCESFMTYTSCEVTLLLHCLYIHINSHDWWHVTWDGVWSLLVLPFHGSKNTLGDPLVQALFVTKVARLNEGSWRGKHVLGHEGENMFCLLGFVKSLSCFSQ